MSNNSPALCQQAYNWIFDKLNKAKFCRELRSKASYSGILHLLTAGGFQLNEKTLLVRKDYLFRNLSKLKDGGFQLATAVAEDSDSISLVHEILSNLKEDTLLDDWRSIIESAETPGIVILALAMFQKDTWQFRLARRLMKTPSAWLGYTHYPDNSHLQYCQIILSLFDVFSSGKNELQSPDNAPSDDELKQLLEREYKRGKSEQEKKTADDKREREAKLKELTKQLQNAEKEIEQLKNEHTRLTQHADENIEALRSKMQEDFQNSIQQLASQWFISNHELQYDTAVAQNKTDAILAKLEQATREQLMQNQTSGSKHALREQRKKLHAAIESLKLAQQDAIV
ncbi:MAG: hypothetical protein J6X55_04255, partial [Victivallales bacterium]|nr:hypothetical protein [Victivallales bacterium]